jgi:hypothetical protein
MSAYRKFVDILQSEPRIPTPPKPPKAPKANPSEPVSLPVLGGLGTLGAPTLKNETSPHAATPPPLSFSARANWDDFKDEDVAHHQDSHDMPLAGAAIIAPFGSAPLTALTAGKRRVHMCCAMQPFCRDALLDREPCE